MPYRKNRADYIVKPDKYKHKKPKSNNPWSRNYDDSVKGEDTTLSQPQDYSQGYQNPYVHTPAPPVFDRPSVQDGEANLRSFMADSNKPPHLQNRWKQQPSKPDFSQLSDREKCCCEPKEEGFDFDQGIDLNLPHSKVGLSKQEGNFKEYMQSMKPWEKSAWEARKRAEGMMGNTRKPAKLYGHNFIKIQKISKEDAEKFKSKMSMASKIAITMTYTGTTAVLATNEAAKTKFLNDIKKLDFPAYNKIQEVYYSAFDFGVTIENVDTNLIYQNKENTGLNHNRIYFEEFNHQKGPHYFSMLQLLNCASVHQFIYVTTHAFKEYMNGMSMYKDIPDTEEQRYGKSHKAVALQDIFVFMEMSTMTREEKNIMVRNITSEITKVAADLGLKEAKNENISNVPEDLDSSKDVLERYKTKITEIKDSENNTIFQMEKYGLNKYYFEPAQASAGNLWLVLLSKVVTTHKHSPKEVKEGEEQEPILAYKMVSPIAISDNLTQFDKWKMKSAI